jgi:HEAT repeat protein
LLLLAVAAAGLARGDDDPVASRLVDLVADKEASAEKRANAAEELGKQGANAKAAVPAILGFFDELLAKKKQKTELGVVTYDHEKELLKVVQGLGGYGAAAEPAVEKLEALLAYNRNVMDTLRATALNQAAARALGKIGSEKGLPLLVQAARKDPSVAVRIAVAEALGDLAQSSAFKRWRAAEAELKVISLTDEEERVRETAKKALRDVAAVRGTP